MDVGKAGWSRSGQCQKLRDRGGGRLPDEERQSDRVAPRERESAAKRGKRGECVSFTIERGGGLAVRYSDERNGSVKYILGRNFLSNFGRGLDEFVARDIASRYPETVTARRGLSVVPFDCREKRHSVERDRCMNGEKCFCARGSMRNNVKRDVESVASLEIINVIYLSLFDTYY